MSRLHEQGIVLSEAEQIARRENIAIKLAQAQAAIPDRRYGARVFNGDGFDGLDPQELASLALRLLDAPNISAAYDLMAGKPTDGSGNYYDRVIAPQHRRALTVLKSVLDRDFQQGKFEAGLDVAAGTGESTLMLATKAKRVTAIDASPAMLDIARKKLRKAQERALMLAHRVHVMDALALDFPPASFDVVIDNGFMAYLEPDEFDQYHRRVFDVLKPGGKYYTYVSNDYDPKVYARSPRAQLAGEVASSLFSQTNILTNRQALVYHPLTIGFDSGLYDITGGNGIERVLVWTKPQTPIQ